MLGQAETGSQDPADALGGQAHVEFSTRQRPRSALWNF
jgi:hypothetical protein